MTIIFKKKANKTPTSDEERTRQFVQKTLDQIKKNRDKAVRNISKEFDKYEGDVIISKEKIDEVIKKVVLSCHSRFPVIDDNRDEIIGVLLAKDLLKRDYTKGKS